MKNFITIEFYQNDKLIKMSKGQLWALFQIGTSVLVEIRRINCEEVVYTFLSLPDKEWKLSIDQFLLIYHDTGMTIS